MYYIDYYNQKFICNIKLNSYISPVEYNDLIIPLKQQYLQYHNTNKYWIIPKNKIDEIIIYFQKNNFEYYVSDIALAEIKKLNDTYQRELIVYRDRQFNFNVLKENIKPFDYQLRSINWALQRSAYLDSHAPGLGKTFINICVFSHLYNNKLIDGIIILAPIGLGLHWKYQILEFVNCFSEDDIVLIDNETKIKPFTKFKDKKVIIIRHDLLADCFASYNNSYKKNKSLKRFKWNSLKVDIKKEFNKQSIFLVVDEAHNFKHSNSIKTKALFYLKQFCDYRALLTATPSINHIEDMYSLLYMVDKSIIKMSENAFRYWISNEIGNRWDRYAIISYNPENVKKLMQSYQHVFIQKLKKDIPELKQKQIVSTIECELSSIQKEIYKKLYENEIFILNQEYDNITWKLFLSKLPLLLEVFDNPLLLQKRTYNDNVLNKLVSNFNLKYDNKIQSLDSLLEEHINNRDEKCIVFDIHPFTLDMLGDRYKKYNPQVIHGSLPIKDKEKDRKEKERIFNFDKDCKLLLLSMQTSSQGINLQYGGHVIIFNTLHWDATLYEQARYRTDRVNSQFDSLIYLLYYPNTLDALRLKKNLNRIILNENMNKILSEYDLNYLLNGGGI